MKKIALMIMVCFCTIGTNQAKSDIYNYRSCSDLYSDNEEIKDKDGQLFKKGLITEFMGIPVDGLKKDMIQKLEAKGFEYDKVNDRLIGEFNGEQVYIFIKTNNNKVYRIAVTENTSRNEQQIIIRFNQLCRQFENNVRYVSLADDDQTISEDTDISYEMNVKNKSFDAHYFQEIDINQIDTISLRNRFLEITDEANESLKEKLNKEEINKFKQIINNSLGTELLKKCLLLKRNVWFTIFENYGKFNIALFYDNEYNRANGEDL